MSFAQVFERSANRLAVQRVDEPLFRLHMSYLKLGEADHYVANKRVVAWRVAQKPKGTWHSYWLVATTESV